MIRPSPDTGTIYLHRESVDIRKAINGLVAIVEAEMDLDPFISSQFVFCSRNRKLVKMVVWEGNGFVLWMKRLEKARFKWPLTEYSPSSMFSIKNHNRHTNFFEPE